jgi:transposase
MDSHKRGTPLERLEVVETGRRRRRSDDEKLRIVTESFEAPRAISSTARRHGISRSLLMTWRRSFGPEPMSPQSEQSGFARVVLAAEVEPAVAATPTCGQMVIVVGRDRRVIVDAGVDAAALARVARRRSRAYRRASCPKARRTPAMELALRHPER